MGKRYDLLITGGVVYDGTLEEGSQIDVAISDGKVVALGELGGSDSADSIDAAGLAVAPGFIDAHTHSDLPSLVAPLSENRIHAGVTTEICGNCGWSAGPYRDPTAEHMQEQYEGLSVTWRTQEEFFDRLEAAGSTVNRAFLVGHGNLRRTAMGGDFDRPASPEEVSRMRELAAESCRAGAIGMSSGLIYPPGCFAEKSEIAEVARVIGERGLIYSTHMRNEGDTLLESLEESLWIAREAGSSLHISHIKVDGRANWHKMDDLRRWWSARKEHGIRVTADRYPYTASHTVLDSILPQWAYEGGPLAVIGRLKSPSDWKRIRDELLERHGDGEFWDEIVIGSTHSDENRPFEGKKLTFAAKEMNVAPVEALRRLLVADEDRTMAMFLRMREENMREIMSWEDVFVGSDSSVRDSTGPTAFGFPHPRTYGTTGKVMRHLVKETGTLTMSEAVHKLTWGVAEAFSLERRGKLAQGFAADLVIFDPDSFADAATLEHPSRLTTGVVHLFVNGKAVIRDGRVTEARPGRVLLHGR